MKWLTFFHGGKVGLLILGAATAMLGSVGFLRAQGQTSSPEWPRSYSVDDDDVVIYQPKVEKWDQKFVEARFAVGVKGKNDQQPVYGSFLARAETVANTETGTVSVYNIKAVDFKFPDAGNRIEQIKRDIAAVSPERPVNVPLDTLVASVPAEEAVTSETVLTETKATAPQVVVSYKPALLVCFDGSPIYREIAGSGLDSAVNTAATLLRPQGKKAPLYLLSNNGQWLTAGRLEGPWQSGQAPDGLKEISADHPVAQAVQSIGASGEHAEAPEVITATTPTELIQFHGQPEYNRTGDSPLVRVQDTDTPLFYHHNQNAFFVLISGRWFRTADLKGPWNNVAQNELPAEFAEIPADDPSAEVRASVAGTPEAEEAVVEAQVPVKAQVSLKDEPKLEVVYDGAPNFQEIEGTECAYAINTTYEVLRVGGRLSGSYYCCHDGVWFVAEGPAGKPWHLATELPRAILDLPTSCPLYHTRFCVVDGYTKDDVTYACTGGYWGTYIDPVTHVCVYGTGVHYPAYVSANFYAGYPWTYGFGCRWRRHHGFVYEARRLASLDHGLVFWRAGVARWGGSWEKGHWQAPVRPFEPFQSWGGKAVMRRQVIISAARRGGLPQTGVLKAHVVFHNKPADRHLDLFEKRLCTGSQGEILRLTTRGWEHRAPGQWVVHSGAAKHPMPVAHAGIHILKAHADSRPPVFQKKGFEPHAAPLIKGGRGREFVVPHSLAKGPHIEKRSMEHKVQKFGGPSKTRGNVPHGSTVMKPHGSHGAPKVLHQSPAMQHHKTSGNFASMAHHQTKGIRCGNSPLHEQRSFGKKHN